MENQKDYESILDRLADTDLITAAIAKGTRAAMRQHKLMGVPLATSKDGRVVLVPPEEIPDDVLKD